MEPKLPARAVLDAESTLTDPYQTTVPEPVRQALKLSKRDKIHYCIQRSGEVVISRAQAADDDDLRLSATFIPEPTRPHFPHPGVDRRQGERTNPP